MKPQINGVNKTYNRNVHALRDLQLTLNSGLLGLPGPNGASKSTLMRILATITKASSGKVKWNGEDLKTSSSFAVLAVMALVLMPGTAVLLALRFWGRRAQRNKY